MDYFEDEPSPVDNESDRKPHRKILQDFKKNADVKRKLWPFYEKASTWDTDCSVEEKIADYDEYAHVVARATQNINQHGCIVSSLGEEFICGLFHTVNKKFPEAKLRVVSKGSCAIDCIVFLDNSVYIDPKSIDVALVKEGELLGQKALFPYVGLEYRRYVEKTMFTLA